MMNCNVSPDLVSVCTVKMSCDRTLICLDVYGNLKQFVQFVYCENAGTKVNFPSIYRHM